MDTSSSSAGVDCSSVDQRMPSWQARLLNFFVRTVVRRRSWGDERALARRARRVFGAPMPYGVLAVRGLSRQRVRARGVSAEWLVPERPGPGVVLYIHGGGFVSCS